MAALAALVVTAFVGLLYAVPADIRARPRDDPTHIAWRSAMVLVAAILATIVYYAAAFFAFIDGARPWGAMEVLGLAPACNTVAAVATCLTLIVALFAGPLVAWEVEPAAAGEPVGAILRDVRDVFARWREDRASAVVAVRNLIVGPAAEEFVFRFVLIPLHVLQGHSIAASIVYSSLWFGVAHLHHIVELARRGMLRSYIARAALFQLAYTTVFGCIAGAFAVATGCGLGVIAAHSFCNAMGFPDVDVFRRTRGWTRAVIAGAYVAGIAAFWYMATHWLTSDTMPCVIRERVRGDVK